MIEWHVAQPLTYADRDGTLTAAAAKESDFWRKTHYGFIHHNGHLYAETVTGDFTMQVTFSGSYAHEYDHAGLMLWVDETTWLKTGIEFTQGGYFASAVVTRDFSDWGVASLPESFRGGAFTIKLKREGGSIEIHYRIADTDPWILLRVAYLSDTPTLHAGRMLCAPTEAGFEATFTNFSLIPATVKE